MHPSTVLFLAANPARVQALQLGEECRAIEDKIRAAKFRDQIRFRSTWAARPDDLLQVLNEDSPSVLHFSGHGAGDQGLCFQSDDGSALSVSADGLAQVMQAAGASVTVVVLNACYSEVQAQALVAHVPCVIGMSDAIRDEEAITYAASFYRALAFGKSVANAYQQGLAALALHPTGGQKRDIESQNTDLCTSTFKLLSRPGTDANCVYIVREPSAKTQCTIVIKATLREFNSDVLARVTEELRQLTGDLSLEITDVHEGSVRLTLSLSPEAVKKLMELNGNGQMIQIFGFEISSISESRMAEKNSPVAVDVVRTKAPPERASGTFSSRGLALTALTSDTNLLAQEILRRTHDFDGEILRLVCTGNMTAALHSLMDHHEFSVYRYCRAMLHDPVFANEVCQRIFLAAGRELKNCIGCSTLRAWLFALAQSLVFDALKLQRRAHIEANTAEVPNTDLPQGEAMDEARLRRAVVRFLDRLPLQTRSVLLLRHQQGLAFEDIAQICTEKPGALLARVTLELPLLVISNELRTGGYLTNKSPAVEKIERALKQVGADYELPDNQLPHQRNLSPWVTPVMMIAYVVLAATWHTDTMHKIWMAGGLGLLLAVWFWFRALTEAAALARAIDVGDPARLFALADTHLRRKRRPAARARFLVARAFAHQLRGECVEALDALDKARPGLDLQPLASAIRIGALVELGHPATELRNLIVRAPRAPALGWLAEGQIAWREGELGAARQRFARVIDDVRAGSAIRAIAHVYAARVADACGEAMIAVHHRDTAANLAMRDATWLRRQAPAYTGGSATRDSRITRGAPAGRQAGKNNDLDALIPASGSAAKDA